MKLQFTFVVLIALFMLAACESAAPTPAATPQSSSTVTTSTPTPSSTLLPTATPAPALTVVNTPEPTRTPSVVIAPTSTVTPGSTVTPRPTLPPFVLTGIRPSTVDVLRFVYQNHDVQILSGSGQDAQELAKQVNIQFADVDHDGKNEILFSSWRWETWEVIAAILRQDRSGAWHEAYYSTEQFWDACGQTRSRLESGIVVFDLLGCHFDGGVQSVSWGQQWIQCDRDNCKLIWSGTFYDAVYTYDDHTAFQSSDVAISEMQRPDKETIQLTTRRFGVFDVPPPDFSSITRPENAGIKPTRSTGPDSRMTYKLKGGVFVLISIEPLNEGTVFTREFDLQTQVTIENLGNTNCCSSQELFDAFLGRSGRSAPAGVTWGLTDPSPAVATDNGQPGTLGEWVAVVVGADDHAACRLTVQHHVADKFSLLGRVELPCIANFTHLAWADLTGDGKDELLLTTLPPATDFSKFIAGTQSLHVYSVGDKLEELATIEGVMSGSDANGAGVRWQDIDGDGKPEVLAGISSFIWHKETIPATFGRQFQVYRWDAIARKFVAGVIITQP